MGEACVADVVFGVDAVASGGVAVGCEDSGFFSGSYGCGAEV